MEKNPLISVIMPAYNAEKTIQKAVDSVLAQTYQSIELIIVDDCSEDRTLQIAQNYMANDKRVQVVSNPQNCGVSKTRHRAVELAKGDWIAFLDSDDMWTPDKLLKQMQVQCREDAKLIFSASRFVDAQGNALDWTLHVPKQVQYRKLLKQNRISNSSVLIEKQCYMDNEMIGDEMHEDFACWLQVLRSGVVAYGVDEPLLIYRLSPASKSGNKIKAAKMNWNTYRSVGLNPIEAMYYMVWYTVNGLLKYKNLKY